MTSARGAFPRVGLKVGLVVALLSATTAGAQSRPPAPSASANPSAPTTARAWYEVTVGGAGMRLTCDLCTPTRDVGAAISAAAGVYAGAGLRLGIEVSRWTYNEDEVREYLNGVGLVAQLSPNPNRRYYLTAGAGWAGYNAGDFRYDAPRFSVGVGYDIPLGGRWVVGNIVSLDAASFGSLRSDGVVVLEDVGMSSIRLAVKVSRR